MLALALRCLIGLILFTFDLFVLLFGYWCCATWFSFVYLFRIGFRGFWIFFIWYFGVLEFVVFFLCLWYLFAWRFAVWLTRFGIWFLVSCLGFDFLICDFGC